MRSAVFTILVVLVCLISAGCREQKHDKWLQGEIIEVDGNLPWLVKSHGGLFSNESVKIGEPVVVIRIQTLEGIYTAKLVEFWNTSRPIEAVAKELKVGTKVNFLIEMSYHGKTVSRFGSDKIGKLFTNEIFVYGGEVSQQKN